MEVKAVYVVERSFPAGGGRLRSAWPQHEEYLRNLAARGILVGGGPWADGGGEVLVLDVPDEVSLHRVVRGDPLSAAALVTGARVRRWNVEYGQLTAAVGAPAAPGAGTLSPHERRIALLVLGGMTNQEIADRLNVSVRAVEQHLTRMYRKLSIRRRAQLASALGIYAPSPCPEAEAGPAGRPGTETDSGAVPHPGPLPAPVPVPVPVPGNMPEPSPGRHIPLTA
ncbi:hypothetical protein GCM10010371_16490 [Streptomyces subrutilus]|uniref:HTH luxR-type domain-containing protein n=1 Tax=Streptomyces subrutilus TaxID=36818 RepID=A0A918QMW2_9ACTN|nr:helix-turn-helix transcriptional regulator [Streptomyces subrutilus]GGZ57745.1 hypothetical protein GCM10010371_16490 [Streptomyces subrutilus]